MKVAWVVADDTVLDPTVDLESIKNIGSIWGGWRSWRNCQTDNVICNNAGKIRELLQREFQRRCNFYIPNSVYAKVDSPGGVRLYEGQFNHDLDREEEIIAMHLAASQNDIILLLGFDWSDREKHSDLVIENRRQHYLNLVKQVIQDNNQVQWVMVDLEHLLGKRFENMENLTQDTLANVISMLAG